MPIHRHLKNVVKNYTEAERKVREATSNDPWGPSSTLMAEIADMTYNVLWFVDIMQMLWKRLNEKGKRHWRHVYKALVLMEYVVKTGSDKVAARCRENVHTVEALREFQCEDEGKDVGASVRERARLLCLLLRDPERLAEERERALKAKSRLTGSNFVSFGGGGGSQRNGGSHSLSRSGSLPPRSHMMLQQRHQQHPHDEEEAAAAAGGEEEQIQLELALAISREEHEEEQRRRQEEERRERAKLEMALEQSRQDEERRKKLHKSNTICGSSVISSTTPTTSLFHQLVDTSLSAAPADLPDPWSSPIVHPPSVHHSSLDHSPTRASPAVASQSSIQSGVSYSPIMIPMALSQSQVSTPLTGPLEAFTSSVGQSQSFVTDQSQPGSLTTPRKTAEDFLGEHRDLVDLDRLVDLHPGSTNPFAVGRRALMYGNPFAATSSNGTVASLSVSMATASTESPFHDLLPVGPATPLNPFL